ncbi:glutamate 5-kinase [Hippea jasoniae]|uniref:glutamate 5-kinase n=1 Tax=Hippea jasoniae TaxID=944479 RepID=UPI000550A6D6|nr:glutamate 5-kinase [Hippea jasoniae]
MDKREFVEALKKAKRLVIKIGSGVIAQDNKINFNLLEKIISDIALLKQSGKQVILVSSGAVASGMSKLKIKNRPENIVHLQALASIGQPVLLNSYAQLFERFNITVSQILITVDDIDSRRRFINAKNTLLSLLKWDILPIINENDTVVIKELRFGDNDNLSYHILNLSEADALIILSDVDGVYSKNPAKKGARLIEEFTSSAEIEIEGKSRLGSGGIKTKIEACKNAAELGKLACIVNGKKEHILRDIFNNTDVRFTFFSPKTQPISSKKSWLLNCNPSGVVVIDDGAKEMLLKNKSLLPGGIVKVYGGFGRGDIINIEDLNGNLIARGITNYDSNEIELIKGKKSSQIVSILGYKYSDDVVHIDNMAVVRYSDD